MNDSYQKRLARAEALIEIARYREAIVELEALAGSDPQNSYVLCSLSLCHYELGNFREALDFAGKAAVADPDREWPFRLMSLSYSALGNTREALKAAETAAEIEPEQPYALQSLAYAQIEHYEYDEAEETANVLLKIAPDQSETYNTLGYLAASRGRQAEAEEHYLRSLSINPESAETMNALGSAYLAQAEKRFGWVSHRGNLGKARDTFLAALKIDPTLELARQNLEVAESHPLFWGGKANGTFFRIHFCILALIALARLICYPVPDILHEFTPYEDRIFTGGVNFFFLLSMILWFQSFLRRSSRLATVHTYYDGKPRREVILYLVVIAVQIVVTFVILVLDLKVAAGALLILMIVFCVIALAAAQVYSRWDNGIDD